MDRGLTGAASAAAPTAPLPMSPVHSSSFAAMADDSRGSSRSADESPLSLDAVRAAAAPDGPSFSAKRLCVKSSSKSAMDAVSRRQYLERALHDVTSQNISIRKAASRYGLSKSSLCDFVRKNGITIPNRRGRRLALATTPPQRANNAAPTEERETGTPSVVTAASSPEEEAPSIKRSHSDEEEEEEDGVSDAKQPAPLSATSFSAASLLLATRGRGGANSRGRRARGAGVANRGGPLVSVGPAEG